ncbi:UDP:flavonoid glycosyltransferase YjiC, YdhE family [Nitrosomonas ureae]|uniref:UDP:flavonoid glycosyltransferase YjiC, YdhE family n=1 Tax=Nitrosomonas ureae TaxID=44577 RepID=A0A285C2Z9_9PROT|nr:glycosyltransferase [Nitrosomonas ureae]SNX61458.1 UDP:flavonoid glycosyltransferase YjiC, YdhE family [Nitrosomonas ureae]
MRLTVVTYGTEGDSRSLVGLCRGLLDAGHEVQFLADRSALAAAQAQGISFHALSGDMKATVDPEGALSKLMQKGGDVTQLAKAVARIADENTVEWMREIIAQAQSSDAILFSGIASYVGLSVAEYLHIPAIGLGLWPMSPTRAFPSPLLPPWQMPGWLNLLSHHAINALMWWSFRKRINEARREVCGQMPRQQMWRDYLVLYGVSRYLIQQPVDWPEMWKICGAWFVDSGAWEPPAALAEFLNAGEAPIYVGFGSMGGFDREKLLTAIVQAIDGRRALFYPGWSGINPVELPGNFHVVGDTPHHWLFPRASMVIHHGGAGTSHTASRAGVPSVVIPFTGDQFFWADKLASAGIAPKYAHHTQINAQKLSSMIDFAAKPDVAGRAKVLGTAMAQEEGVACAVRYIERHMTKGV